MKSEILYSESLFLCKNCPNNKFELTFQSKDISYNLWYKNIANSKEEYMSEKLYETIEITDLKDMLNKTKDYMEINQHIK